jgi:hypothetical protein
MRLIRKEEVAKAIREYWDHIETLYRVRDRLELAGETIADVSSRIFIIATLFLAQTHWTRFRG